MLIAIRKFAVKHIHPWMNKLTRKASRSHQQQPNPQPQPAAAVSVTTTVAAEWKISLFTDAHGCPVIRNVQGAVDGVVIMHGQSVVDPFQCLEDSAHPSTQQFLWLEQQVTEEWFAHNDVKEIQQKFLSRYLSAQVCESIENPVNKGGTYFFFKRLRPELPQYSLFATKDLNVEARLVFDPNTLRINSTSNAATASTTNNNTDNNSASGDENDPTQGMLIVHATWISVDGFRLAFGYSTSTMERELSIGIRDLVSGKDLTDRLTGCVVDYTTVAWIESRTGFFYTTVVQLELPPNTTDMLTSKTYSHRVLFHKLQTNQRLDVLIFETQTTTDCLSIGAQITSDGHYLLVELFPRNHATSSAAAWGTVSQENTSPFHNGNKIYYFDLSKFDGVHVMSLGPCVRLIDSFLYRFDYISNIEDEFWFRTNYKAPNFRVVRLTLPEFTVEDKELDGLSPSGIPADSAISATIAMKREAYKCLQAWKTCLDWIPQRLDGVFLESGAIAAHTVLVLKYAKAASHEVLLYDLTQELIAESQIPVADLPHPAHGTISGPNCNFYSSEIFYQYSDLSDPSSIYRALIDRDPYSGAIEISFSQVNSTNIPGIDKYKFDIKQSFVECEESKVLIPITKFALRSVLDIDSDDDDDDDDDNETGGDGSSGVRQRTVIFSLRREEPVTSLLQDEAVSSKKRSKIPNKKSRSPRPCILCVNSGFGISLTPTFSLPFALFAHHCQGLVVIANLQGSGVYGKTWTENGIKSKKSVAVQDLMSTIRFLVKHRYTSYSQLSLYGGTHNGLIIGSLIAQYPMMCNAVVIEDGIFDLLKVQKFNPPLSPMWNNLRATSENANVNGEVTNSMLHSLWYKEFGCAEESELELSRMLAFSPLHCQRNVVLSDVSTYPAVLCCTGILIGDLF
jgi:protease II